MSPADRVTYTREAVSRTRTAVAHVRALLAATERVLTALEAMLSAEIPNVIALRKALDAASSTQRATHESWLSATEAADRVQDAHGANTRLMVR